MFATFVKPLNAQQNDMNTPILPKKRIKKCLIGQRYSNEIRELEQLAIECIAIPSLSSLENEISNHADMLCFNCGNGNLLVQSDVAGELDVALRGYNVIPVNDIFSPYPNDVKLNSAFLGKHLLCNSKFIAPQLKAFCEKYSIEIINTNQGYSKCSVCVISNQAVITEDDGIACLLKNYQYNVLKITPGFIALSEKHSGFIGGATAKISSNELYVSGDISKHPDYNDIKSFSEYYNVSLIYNDCRKLTDFGGMIQLY